ncbi:MAG: hypothetical protein WCK73_08450 [Deltaproteobacteria bacterium]
MRTFLRIAAAAALLAVAAPAAAQYTFLSPDQQPPPLRLEGWRNTVRVNVGVGLYNSDWYVCAYGWTCAPTSYASWVPFVVGPQFDLHISGPSAISLGLLIGFGTVKSTVVTSTGQVDHSAKVTTYEPTLDYVVLLGTPLSDTAGRLRFGGGLLIGPDTKLGFLGRVGAGVAFFNTNRWGVGLDLVLEGGSMNGSWMGGVQLVASPEFRF